MGFPSGYVAPGFTCLRCQVKAQSGPEVVIGWSFICFCCSSYIGSSSKSGSTFRPMETISFARSIKTCVGCNPATGSTQAVSRQDSQVILRSGPEDG
eukprot:scaffold49256_cov25-Cyclotella_meneghiniana.AAC.1